MEYDSYGNEMLIWHYKKTNKRDSSVTALIKYRDINVNLNEPIEVASDSKFNGEFRIIGNKEDYPEYFI
jgi:hypothetical protein